MEEIQSVSLFFTSEFYTGLVSGSITTIIIRRLVNLLAKIGGVIAIGGFIRSVYVKFPSSSIVLVAILASLASLVGCSSTPTYTPQRPQEVKVADIGGKTYCIDELERFKKHPSFLPLREEYRACVRNVINSSIFINPYNRYKETP